MTLHDMSAAAFCGAFSLCSKVSVCLESHLISAFKIVDRLDISAQGKTETESETETETATETETETES